MSEDKKPKSEETVQSETSTPPKYVAFIVGADGNISISVEGVDFDEARRIISHGRAKFENEYEIYLRRVFK